MASFLQSELPIRLAKRIEDLDKVPRMRDMPSVQAVKGVYIHSFLDLLEAPPIQNPEAEANFAILLERLYQNHSNVLLQMARGACELRQAVRRGMVPGDVSNDGVVETFEHMDKCHRFLDRFYMSRVGIRVLVGQYLALRRQSLFEDEEDNDNDDNFIVPGRHMPPNYIGMICRTTSPYHIVQTAANDATRMCLNHYGRAPQVHIHGRLDLTFPYLPTHLHYILLELLKNALRATTEFHSDKSIRDIPPVTVIIADGTDNEDVVIKVMDEGGGIPRSKMDHIWSYLYTTADPAIQQALMDNPPNANDGSLLPPIAGLGFGLPMSRTYARYFGGDLDLMSMEGYGTDAFCYLARLGDKVPVSL